MPSHYCDGSPATSLSIVSCGYHFDLFLTSSLILSEASSEGHKWWWHDAVTLSLQVGRQASESLSNDRRAAASARTLRNSCKYHSLSAIEGSLNKCLLNEDHLYSIYMQRFAELLHTLMTMSGIQYEKRWKIHRNKARKKKMERDHQMKMLQMNSSTGT